MRHWTIPGATAALTLAAALAAPAVAAEVNKTYMRKGNQEVRVFTVDGKLYCRRTSDAFEMCYGMDPQGDGHTWKGNQMRHPMMGKKMTFDGTVVIGTNKRLKIQGCQLGGLFCDSEVWDEQ